MEKAREPAAAGEGREGDWDCSGCLNRNYAFRSFCNRCKQPRLLVDTKTPADSKWLPRIGDWICTGCSNNNYASREKCKKCGQPKEIAAMPAIAMPGASLPSYAHYFARAHGAPGYKMMSGNSPLTSSPNWTVGGAARYGLHAPGGWPLHGNSTGNFPFPQNVKQVSMVPKGWREGDWLCSCGFHNYSSRAECKKCNASMPGGGPCSTMSSAPDIVPTLGMKRLASDEFAYDWDNKRLNAGVMNSHFLTNGPQHSFQGFGQIAGSSNSQANEFYSSHSSGSAGTSRHFEVHAQSQQVSMMPTIIGKGAKQWRDGDWMCTNCNNHNFASRSQCNRCKTQKDSSTQPVLVS